MLSEAERVFLESCRVGHLATADKEAAPHLVPVCFALIDTSLYIAIDEKPKRTDIPLKRLRNIRENPQVAFTTDRYDEDWRQLGWVMLRGRAEILQPGTEHAEAQTALKGRYAQLGPMRIAHLPVIALRIALVASWGNLSIEEGR